MSLYRLAGCCRLPSLLQSMPKRMTRVPNHTFQERYFRFNSRDGSTPFKSKQSFGFVELSEIQTGEMTGSALIKPLIFTVGFSLATFTGAAILEYENYRSKLNKAFKSPFQQFHQRKNDLISEIKTHWNALSTADRFFIPILGANLLIFGLWRIPALKLFMYKYFTANPAMKTICWPMFLSSFSHYSFFHIFANMYVLHSFSFSICNALGNEQTLAMYLSAGVVASYASYVYKTMIGVSGFSLGASGSIMAVLGYVCSKYPDTQISIIFLPMYTFSAGVAIKCLVGVDLLGCLFRWRFFDHAAHLGGALFGILWYYYGATELWPKRKMLVEKWHEIRSKRF